MEKRYCAYCMNEIHEDICPHCGKEQSSYKVLPHYLPNGTVLNGKYIVGAVLGEGGFGITYIGRDVNLNIKIAVKEYYPSGTVNRNHTYSSEITAITENAENQFKKGKNNFLEEARILAKFNDEPSIVSVRDFFSENNTAYIVMEYLEGTTVEDYLKHYGNFSFSQTVAMLSPVMSGLSKIHKTGLIHRDISPANIMILKNNAVKLLDFGAARETDSSDKKSLSVMLKPGFAPEEQYRTKGNQGSWTDVYALSATMYKMLTGVTPTDAMNRLFSDDVEKISVFNPRITESQENVIMKGMAVNQSDRYQTIDEFENACLSVLEGCASGEKTVSGNISERVIEDISIKPTPVKKKADMSVRKKNEPNKMEKSEKPEIHNKKPNVVCRICCIIFTVLSILCGVFTMLADSEVQLTGIILSVILLAFAIFFGFFYFPRLERKKKIKLCKRYGGICAAFIVVIILFTVFSALGTVKIGNKSFKLSETDVVINYNTVTNNELENLKKLKNLESLNIGTSFLDNNSIEILGELSSLKELSISGNTDVTDITPLYALGNLVYLDISNTKVNDISSIDRLTLLESLDISDTEIKSLNSIKNLEKLNTLKMNKLKLLDVSTISLPKGLETLECNSNGLNSLEFIASAKSMLNLEAANNNITDLTDINRYKLANIDLSHNKISNLSGIQTDYISSLNLSYNDISDISPLNGIKAHSVKLGNNKISDISVFKGNSQLFTFEINNNQIEDISVLCDCFNLHALNISHNLITNIDAIATMDNLEIFEARNNRINDISPLESCKKMIESGSTIELRDNSIADIKALSKYENTTHIYLSNNKISDISSLGSCRNAEMLLLNNNNITDVSQLAVLTKLSILQIVNNPLNGFNLSLNPGGVAGNATLSLSYSDSIDFSELANEEKLTVVIYGANARQEYQLRKLGFRFFSNFDKLDAETVEDAEEKDG